MSSLLSDVVAHCLDNGVVYTAICTGFATAVVGMLFQIGLSWASKGHRKENLATTSLNSRCVSNGSAKPGTRLHEVVDESVQTSDCDGSLLEASETRRLLEQVDKLTKELKANEGRITKLREEESKLRDRFSEQVQSKIDKGSTKFEDLSLGENRPSVLVQRFKDLYAENRLEVMDELDRIDELASCDELKQKLLFSIVVLCFRRAQESLEDLITDVRRVLQRRISTATNKSSNADTMTERLLKDVDAACLVYLRRNIDKHDLTLDHKEVSTQLWTTLDEYPCLKTCKELERYIKDCLRLAWALVVQSENYGLYHDVNDAFRSDRHTRFHTSDPNSTVIVSLLWPGLVEGITGVCVSKAVVVT